MKIEEKGNQDRPATFGELIEIVTQEDMVKTW